jgi:MFS family permease
MAFWIFYKNPRAREVMAHPSDAMRGEPAPSRVSLWRLARNRKVIGVSLGMFAYNYNFYLYLTWLPTYLHDTLHFDIAQSGLYSAVPWLAATVSNLAIGGWLVDHLIGRGHDPSRVRAGMLVFGLAVALSVLGALTAHSAVSAMAWITVAVAGISSVGAVVWSIPGLIAPREAVGKVGAIMNCVGNVPGILAPIVTGYLLRRTMSYTTPFAVAAAMLVMGAVSFVLVMGDTEPMVLS